MSLFVASTPSGELDVAEPWEPTIAAVWQLGRALGARPLSEMLPQWAIPEAEPVRPPQAQLQLAKVKEWTEWSARAIGDALGTTHPTIEAIVRGQSRTTGVPGLARRLSSLYELVKRLRVVVNGDPIELARALRDRPAPDRASALELLQLDRLSDAYLAALDALEPPRVAAFMRSRYPSRPGHAPAPLDDE